MFQITTFIILIVSGTLLTMSSGFCPREDTQCGDIQISAPFWTENNGHPVCNGYPAFFITCINDEKAVINISNHRYLVRSIAPARITVLDMDIAGQQCPRPRRNFSIDNIPYLKYPSDNKKIIFFYNCSHPPEGMLPNVPCLDSGSSFAFLENDIPRKFNWYGNCKENVAVWVTFPGSIGEQIPAGANYTERLLEGFPLRYINSPSRCIDCEDSGGDCRNITSGFGFDCYCAADDRTLIMDQQLTLVLFVGVLTGLGTVLVISVVVYRSVLYKWYVLFVSCWRDKIESPSNIDIFLASHGCLAQRYRYSDIKKMTNSFKDEIGRGGYGSVYKGKLPSGRLVAVKVLKESKGNGEEFINEVATIGTTNHVNVVSLLGFCTDRSDRALIYEFMPNGSLEKYVYQDKEAATDINRLGHEKLYQIAVGIARGLDYLHRGCNTAILHLDIKPHNILLDQDFCPKISDFGLAKLCPPKVSIVSMDAPRGTLGYIAPEVYAHFGAASHKSDVYSYGMMVLEMIGGRKNIDATVKNTSEIYLPELIYKRFKQGINVKDFSDPLSEEKTKKMIVAALWCIQAQPMERPSISKVVEMLEGKIEEMGIPPNPFVGQFAFGDPGSLVGPITSSQSTESRNYLSQSSLGGR
ncbi:hypothetical protein ACHQM5_004089 [Ranunculus cassubicifolius]